MKKYGGFSDQQLKEVFTWGKGPAVHVFDIEITKFDDNLEVEALGFTSNWQGGIGIDIDMVQKLESANLDDREQLLFLVGVTILHETVHWGFDLNKLPIRTTKDEGVFFEKKAYGAKVTVNNFREVYDRNQRSRGLMNDAPPLVRPESSAGSSEGQGVSSPKIKSSEGDADRKSSKRSAGAY